MDALLEIKKIIDGLLSEEKDALKDNEGNDLYDFKGGDALKFYDKQNKIAGVRLRKAMGIIKGKAQEVRMEVSRIKKAAKEA